MLVGSLGQVQASVWRAGFRAVQFRRVVRRLQQRGTGCGGRIGGESNSPPLEEAGGTAISNISCLSDCYMLRMLQRAKWLIVNLQCGAEALAFVGLPAANVAFVGDRVGFCPRAHTHLRSC